MSVRGLHDGLKAGVLPVADRNAKLPGVAVRYARALFDLAKEAGETEKTGADLERLGRLLEQSDDLARFIASPLLDKRAQADGLAAVMEKIEAGRLARDFVQLVALKGRLALLPEMIAAYQALVAQERGEVSALVTSAARLTAAQEKKIAEALKVALGKDVQIENAIDPSILGGLIVRVGSRMIDTSIKTRLNTLKTMLKGA